MSVVLLSMSITVLSLFPFRARDHIVKLTFGTGVPEDGSTPACNLTPLIISPLVLLLKESIVDAHPYSPPTNPTNINPTIAVNAYFLILFSYINNVNIK